MFRVALCGCARLGNAMRDIADGNNPEKWFIPSDKNMMNFIREDLLKSSEQYSPATRFRVILVWNV